ncbi:hypothetical protein HO133_003597 [Letharia lupina]|uniref:Uncharacterized protein n=1 Tax=Letharia lupina TaxID=560253 RepID=A0A8H6F913_9LECA|nr:uncharacterized protein HO133_003597 [Letharia lupina]KAF6219772.1 hypothetical protein HO133_003597 [Letharia lupina]
MSENGKREKHCEELSKTKPKFHEATDIEENEEFSWPGALADVFAPQHNKRVAENTASLGKRVPLTAADKKKIDKESIGLPIPRTLKLFTYNCRPFILEDTIPLEEYRERYPDQLVQIRIDIGSGPVFETRRSQLYSAPAVQQRTSLSGTTLHSTTKQQTFAALQELAPRPSEDFQTRQISNNTASPVILHSHQNNIKPELLLKIYTWLDHVSISIAAEPESLDSVSDLVIDEEVWELIERSARQRKSRLRQIPNTMSTEISNTSVRGSNNNRPSGSYRRPGEGNTHTATNLIKDHPGTSAREPKNMPSGSQLPSCWNDDMDEFICHMEAQCEFSTKSIVKALKHRFAGLREHVIQEEAIQRRIDTLDSQDNPYFKKGAELAIVQAEANGYEVPPFDPANYPIINWEVKPDHIVLGSSPSKEVMNPDYEYSLQPRVAGGVDIDTIKIGPDTPKKTLPIRTRQEADRRVQNAATYFNTKGLKGLADITNISSSRDPKQEPSNEGGLADITNTMYNARIASNPNHDLNGSILSGQVYSTPTKNSKKAMSETSNDTIRAINNGSPTPTRGLYRSGRDNAMSSSTTGTSILGFGREGFGRENSGGPTILERRRARQENRDSSLVHGAGGSPRTP